MTDSPVVIAPVTLETLAIFDSLAFDIDTLWRSTYRGSLLTAPPRSPLESWGGATFHYLVLQRTRRIPVGLVSGYNANYRAGHIHLAALALPKWQRTGLVVLGAGIVLHKLFTTEPFRKVYLDIAEYNVPQIGNTLSELFELELVLPQMFFFDGRYWDQHFYSTCRSAYMESFSLADMELLRWQDEDVFNQVVSYAI